MRKDTVLAVGAVLFGLLTLILAVGVFRGSRAHAFPMGGEVEGVRFWYVQATTNNVGRFDAPHGIPTSSLRIVGAVASIQSKVNKSWYIPGAASNTKSVLAWDDVKVSGSIDEPGFAGQPVRILVFVIPVIK